RLVSLDEELAAALRRDYTQALLSDQDRVMLDYAAKLTTCPAQVTADDLQRLRAAGFDDRGILQINVIASWFNYINRVADGLGVQDLRHDLRRRDRRSRAALSRSPRRQGALATRRAYGQTRKAAPPEQPSQLHPRDGRQAGLFVVPRRTADAGLLL